MTAAALPPSPSSAPSPAGRILAMLGAMPPLIRVAAATMAALVLLALAAPLIAPYGLNEQHLLNRLQPPLFLGGDGRHLLGADHLGRDVLSRLLYGLRTTLMIATLGVLLGALTGALAGLAAGSIGGWVDSFFMLLVDTQASVPLTLLALAAAALIGGSDPLLLILIVGISDYDKYARVVRGQVMSLRGRAFVESARAVGASPLRIAFRHVLPNLLSTLVVVATLNLSSIVVLVSALSFLGVGVQPPNTSLGALLGDARDYLITSWWLAAAPCALIVMITLSASLIGDWLRDVFDPNLGE